ncbi:MAG: type III pantothenate kinase [Flavobacteriaceae bacterium]|jgi:type III pantothenate kinase|nr:type III pantothenate kinase [Candidatus Neomarinimicrobiota bacterium]MBT4113571.1 type III pantothenate kinase [Flavobacteriaceae bacterium]MBT6635964.1 type III pantothenate kinase [Flavobacteriaceae bacterium]MBT7404009.1 type III pantothenate kinase [Flavobacteriaceae bacterium]|tara:strand:+ start:62 stop:793 length:732 start_codon:yes stop_codon:yes gene_type:complete
MNLIIDIGNTNGKIAVFKHDKIVKVDTVKTSNIIEGINKFTQKYKAINRAIVSNVSINDNHEIKEHLSLQSIYFLSENLKLPFKNLYKSKERLGSDRIALASAAIKHYPNSNVLVIDAGTCITMDFIDKKGNYHGGSISPGIDMRYSSLNNYTSNLPKLEKNDPSDIIGSSTEDSIHSGIVNGVIFEIRESISEYQGRYEGIKVILTGGDSVFLSKPLKISIFANRNFLLEGLNFILNLNIDS